MTLAQPPADEAGRDGAAPARPSAPGERLLVLADLLSAPEFAAEPTLSAGLQMVAELVPEMRWLSLTRRRSGERAATLASTGDVALAADEVQYDVGTGPCLDALEADEPIVSLLREEARWAGFTQRVRAELPVRAIVSSRVALPGQTAMSLNAYADDDAALAPGVLDRLHVAAAGMVLLSSAVAQRVRADNLHRAMATSRQIGAAVGILMHRNRWTYDQAFDALRAVSQSLHRKLRDIADEVVLSGTLPTP